MFIEFWLDTKREEEELRQSGASIFAMHGIEKDKVFKVFIFEKYSYMNVETWLGNTDVKF